jgi:hypothetical protein
MIEMLTNLILFIVTPQHRYIAIPRPRHSTYYKKPAGGLNPSTDSVPLFDILSFDGTLEHWSNVIASDTEKYKCQRSWMLQHGHWFNLHSLSLSLFC